METNNFENKPCCDFSSVKSPFTATFMVVLIVFFVILSLFTFVGAINKMKEGKYIGQGANVAKPSISVSGTGEVYAKPDLGMVSFSVVSDGATVEAALKDNTSKMNAVIAATKGQGVDDEDLKTTGFNVSPRYNYEEKTGNRTLVGYEVNQQLQVKIRNLDKAGAILSAATAAGANDIGGLQFTIDDEEEVKNQARTEAINDAKAKAKELASQLGVKLGKISGFNENGMYPVYENTKAMSAISSVAPAAPDIQTGQNRITSNVTIVYELE